MGTVERIQIASRSGPIYTAPQHGSATLDLVYTADPADIDSVANAIDAALASVPESTAVREKRPSGRWPYQTLEGVKSPTVFERRLRLLSLTRMPDHFLLERWIPYPGERRGFTIDEQWTQSFPPSTTSRRIAQAVVDAVSDPNWPLR